MIKGSEKKYRSNALLSLEDRTWPGKTFDVAPDWCSVDMRAGNQVLKDAMGMEEKLSYFRLLYEIGFRQIEVGSPSSSVQDRDFLRALIERDCIPFDAAVQVTVPARRDAVISVFDALNGARNVIINLTDEIPLSEFPSMTEKAVRAASLIADTASKLSDMHCTFEYTPEVFSLAPVDDTLSVCKAVLDSFGVSAENKVIINLSEPVEILSPSCFADAVEYFRRNLPNNAVISVNTHNDRGTAVAASELAFLAGARRIEGSLFGNGERTGNADIITIALNLFSNGTDPGLNLERLPDIIRRYEKASRMRVGPRQPYSGQFAFSEFSPSRQEAVNDSLQNRPVSTEALWSVPYLQLDPADIGRNFESVSRVNRRSGEAGRILEAQYGYTLPRAMSSEFDKLVEQASEESGEQLTPKAIYDLFESTYVSVRSPYRLASYTFDDKTTPAGGSQIGFTGKLYYNDIEYDISGTGNGPIDAFFNAISDLTISRYHFVSYSEHAVSSGSDSRAAAYIQLKAPDGGTVFGVGLSHNIYLASIRGIICAINRGIAHRSVNPAPRRTF